MTWLLILLLQAHAQNQTPCNLAVQEFKEKCAKFVFQFAPKFDEPDEGDPKRCEQIRRVSQDAERKFKEICGANADAATRKCQETATGGITGKSGSTTMSEDLGDLNHMLKWFHDEYMKNLKSSNCPDPQVS